MCKLPSPQLQKLLSQVEAEAARLKELNKQAARDQLLRAQILISRNRIK